MDLIMPWVTVLAWMRSVVSLSVFGRIGQTFATRWGVRVWVTAASVGVRLAMGRRQLQMFLDGAKESVLQELREKKVCISYLERIL